MNPASVATELRVIGAALTRLADAVTPAMGGTGGANQGKEAPATPATKPAFIGIRVDNKYTWAKCEVCGEAIPVGAPTVYNPDVKRAAHLACGVVEPSR